MKGLMVALTLLAVLTTLAPVAYAEAPASTRALPGPYEGTFRGIAYGDKGSKASLGLDLQHRGRDVTGTVRLEEGLYVSGGWCGAVSVPATEQYVEGQTAFANPRRLAVTPVFQVGGIELAIDFESNLSKDGDVITARAKVDLPWFCGRDPVLTSTLYRYESSIPK